MAAQRDGTIKWLSFTLALGYQPVEMEGVQVFFKCNGWALLVRGCPCGQGLVSPAEDGAILCRFPAIYASAAVLDFLSQHRRLIYWDAAHGGAGFLLDFRFA